MEAPDLGSTTADYPEVGYRRQSPRRPTPGNSGLIRFVRNWLSPCYLAIGHNHATAKGSRLMALRAAERSKLPATRDGLAKTPSASRATAVAVRAIPLDLAPLIQPYRKQGRLSLRIE